MVGGLLEWQIAAADGERFAELIEALIVNRGQAINTSIALTARGIEVKISFLEYPEDFHS